jgi:hypothetical protein
MSKHTAATLDPYIDNPEMEHDQIIAEGLEQALVAGVQQQAASGQIPPLVIAKVMKLVKDDKMEIAEAFNKITEDALKEKQAEEEAAAPTAESMTADAALMAMAGPQGGAAAAQGMPSVAGANPSQQNLGNLLNTLRKGSRV